MDAYIIRACHIQIYISNEEHLQCHWAISTAAFQLLIGVGDRDKRIDQQNTAMYDTKPKNWPKVFCPHQDLWDVNLQNKNSFSLKGCMCDAAIDG